MRFKSRHKKTWPALAREWVWPKSGWIRWSLYFWRRVWRLTDSPHTIAIGFVAGSVASFTPFIGFHFVVGFFFAWLVRGNLLASAIGTSVGNPLTFPFIWFATFNVGNWILGGKTREANVDPSEMAGLVWDELYFNINVWIGVVPKGGGPASGGVDNAWLDVFWPLIKPMMVGGLLVGPCFAAIIYFPVRAAVEAYQDRRRKRLIARHLVPSPSGPDEATS